MINFHSMQTWMGLSKPLYLILSSARSLRDSNIASRPSGHQKRSSPKAQTPLSSRTKLGYCDVFKSSDFPLPCSSCHAQLNFRPRSERGNQPRNANSSVQPWVQCREYMGRSGPSAICHILCLSLWLFSIVARHSHGLSCLNCVQKIRTYREPSKASQSFVQSFSIMVVPILMRQRKSL